MGKLGENVPLLIDKAVDFMASSGRSGVSEKLPPVTRFRPEYLMKACRYIYNVWSIIVSFIVRNR